MATTTTTETMKGAMVVAFNERLEVKSDLPIPVPRGSKILVKINACSLCMSDLAGHSGALGMKLPYCAGHEPVGTVAGLSKDSPTPGFAVGDRVGFMPASDTCQACYSCLSGNHRFCKKKTSVGFAGSYGGFSEYALADPLSTVKIPDGLTDEEAAPLLCAGVTAYAAIKKVSKFQPGGTIVNIIGCGGVGHLAIQYAQKMGYIVQAFDIAQDKLDLALRCGAESALNSTSPDVLETAKPARVSVVVSGAGPAYDFAFKLTQNHGTIIAIGVPHKPINIDVLSMVLRDIALIPTNQGTKQELWECLDVAARLGIKPIYELRKVEDINQGVEDMKKGKINGRLVYTF